MESLYLDDILTFLVFAIIAYAIPGILTIWNIYNLCAKTPKMEKIISWLTIFIGGLCYSMLYSFQFETSGDWYEQVNVMQHHYSISSQYGFSIGFPVLLGFVGLIILFNVNADKLPPLVSALSIASVLIFNIIQIVIAVQISKNVDGIGTLLYVYHANIFIISVAAVRRQVKQQVELYKDRSISEEENGKKISWLYKKINSFSQYTILVFICLFFIIAILEILFIIFRQGIDAPIKAFTDTADWTFSKQLPPPPAEYQGHYLCTVAAGGHQKVVKPLRYGKRHGAIIVVNRQLCIANAFEEYIQEKFPTVHKYIRGFYDKYGYPVSKHITTPVRADVIYVIMKPLEWLFLVFLYMFDIKPEQRIHKQYL